MPNMLVRALSGAVYVLLITGLLLWSSTGFTILMTVFAILASLEFTAMTEKTHNWLRAVDVIFTACPVALIIYLTIKEDPLTVFQTANLMLIGFLFLIVAYPLIRLALQLAVKEGEPVESASRGILSLIYIGLPLALLAISEELSFRQGNVIPVLAGFIMIWMNDTGAYLAGRAFGRHKLFERISPKKTIEGAVGGAIASMATGAVFALVSKTSMPMWIIMGATVSVLATAGDLVESMIKREEGVKDSGRVMPGHGGILDRIDSLLYVSPAIFLFSLMF